MRWTCDTSNITWRSKSSNDAWKCLKSALDLSDCLVMQSRLTDLLPKTPDSQTSSNGTVEWSVSVEQSVNRRCHSTDRQRCHCMPGQTFLALLTSNALCYCHYLTSLLRGSQYLVAVIGVYVWFAWLCHQLDMFFCHWPHSVHHVCQQMFVACSPLVG